MCVLNQIFQNKRRFVNAFFLLRESRENYNKVREIDHLLWDIGWMAAWAVRLYSGSTTGVIYRSDRHRRSRYCVNETHSKTFHLSTDQSYRLSHEQIIIAVHCVVREVPSHSTGVNYIGISRSKVGKLSYTDDRLCAKRLSHCNGIVFKMNIDSIFLLIFPIEPCETHENYLEVYKQWHKNQNYLFRKKTRAIR